VFQILTDLILSHHRGDDSAPIPHRPLVPHHLCDQVWRYACTCGHAWEHRADAEFREGEWRCPIRQCLKCHGWHKDGARRAVIET
jgi:hypothetical protein